MCKLKRGKLRDRMEKGVENYITCQNNKKDTFGTMDLKVSIPGKL